jgi:two-component system, OmpR family, sensor histidine kinase KdpD
MVCDAPMIACRSLASQVEAATQSERLRTALLDALAHEFKTPLTSVIGATSALLDNPEQPLPSRLELLKVADEEAHHLRELIDDTVEMGRLDTAEILVQAEKTHIEVMVREVVASMRNEIDERPVQVVCDEDLPAIAVDRRLMKLAI